MRESSTSLQNGRDWQRGSPVSNRRAVFPSATTSSGELSSDRVFTYAVKNQIDPVAVRKIFEILIEMNEEQQRECAGDGDLP